MRETFKLLGANLMAGVVPDPHVDPDADFIADCEGGRATPLGLRTPELVVQPTATEADGWPGRMLFVGDRKTLAVGPDWIEQLDINSGASVAVDVFDAASPEDPAAITPGDAWQHASMYDNYFLSNAVSFVFSVPGYSPHVLATDAIRVGALGRDSRRKRILVGNLSGTWYGGDRFAAIFETWRETQADFAHKNMGFDGGWAIWSDDGGGDTGVPFVTLLALIGALGNAAFDSLDVAILDQVEKGQIGFVYVGRGDVLAFKDLQDDVIAYGAGSVTRLTARSDGYGYTSREVGDSHLHGRCAVTGDTRRHVWIDRAGALAVMPGVEREIDVLGYQWALSDLGSTAESQNLISNGAFSATVAPWYTSNPGGALALEDGAAKISGNVGATYMRYDFDAPVDLLEATLSFDVLLGAFAYTEVQVIDSEGNTFYLARSAAAAPKSLSVDVLASAISLNNSDYTEEEIAAGVQSVSVLLIGYTRGAVSNTFMTVDNISLEVSRNAQIIASWDSKWGEAWFCGPERARIFSPTGLGGSHEYRVSSLHRDKELYGFYQGERPTEIRLTTLPMRFNMNGGKAIVAALVRGTGIDAGTVQVANGPVKPLSPNMGCFPRTRAEQLPTTITLQGEDITVGEIELRVQYDDRKMYRGTRAVSA